MPRNQHWITIEVPREVEIEEIQRDDVPGWEFPDQIASRAYGDASRAYGDEWLRAQRTVVLVVPSVVAAPNERNVVINHDHPDLGRLSASAPKPVIWDPRLFHGEASWEE